MNWIKRNWLYLAIGGAVLYYVTRPAKAVAAEPLLPGDQPRPGGGLATQQVTAEVKDQIKFFALKEANAKGMQGNVGVFVDANAVRVVFTGADGVPKVAVFATAEQALAAAQAANVW
ncbi:MAG: hypothetical protein JRD89_20210 [Deltaproteobacteria bacterium]|nr:hypothetical protein [Deltaproteobacteria bacterium]